MQNLTYSLKMPSCVYAGAAAYERLAPSLSGVKRAVLFTNANLQQAGLLTRIEAALQQAGVSCTVIADLPVEPTADEAAAVIARFRAEAAELIVAVGGGSVIDVAKLASVLDTDEYSVYDLLDTPSLAKKTGRCVAIPTTAGTGAEATPNSIVTVPEKQLKIGIVSDALIPDAVLLDAEMLRHLPRSVAASTGVDALAHAIECYTSKKATPISDTFALEAFRLIVENIERACNENDMAAKESMLLASFYAGVAITASGTTGVHALSYPLGGRYRIAHGIANAMLLMPVMHFNEPVARPLFARAYDRVMPGGGAKTEEEKSAWVLSRMDEIVKNVGITDTLATRGVPREDLDELVAAGMQVTRLLTNNLREITAQDAREIYLRAF